MGYRSRPSTVCEMFFPDGRFDDVLDILDGQPVPGDRITIDLNIQVVAPVTRSE